jgi:hypothetical protein
VGTSLAIFYEKSEMFLPLAILASLLVLRTYAETNIYTDGTYLLTWVNNGPTIPQAQKDRLNMTFYQVYPKEVQTYNTNAPKNVTFVFDPNYTGVAATSNAVITFRPSYIAQNPEDLDVITHEAMHVVQAYSGFSEGWITEGIADYVRFQFGVNNDAQGWSLPEYAAGQSYKNGYGVTARFFLWIEKVIKAGTVVNLDKAARTKTYTSAFWTAQTGKTVDQLWAQYTQNPKVPGYFHQSNTYVNGDEQYLTILNKDENFTLSQTYAFVSTWQNVYPKEVKAYNVNAPKKVTFIIDPNYNGVAGTVGTVVTYSSKYFIANPQDTDAVTHELMHIVQAYNGFNVGWITEGIADFARNQFGTNNAAAGWSLGEYSSTQKYTDSYRVTARFFTWLEKKVKSGIVHALNTVARNNSYSDSFWTSQTGKTIDQLWAEYGQNPAL